jgi:hypothetical protein
VLAPLPPLTMLKTYYLISFDLKIVLTTLHKGEAGQEPLLQEGEGHKLLVSTIFARDCRPFIFIIFLIFSAFSHEKTGTR